LGIRVRKIPHLPRERIKNDTLGTELISLFEGTKYHFTSFALVVVGSNQSPDPPQDVESVLGQSIGLEAFTKFSHRYRLCHVSSFPSNACTRSFLLCSGIRNK